MSGSSSSGADIILSGTQNGIPLYDPLKAQQFQENRLKILQDQKAAKAQNRLAALYQNPKNLQNGMLTQNALGQIMAIDPTTGMQVMQLQDQTAQAGLDLASDQHQYLADNIATPAMEAYQTALKTMTPPAAATYAQTIYSDGLNQAKSSGLFSPDQISQMPSNFDPIRVGSNLMKYQDWVTAQQGQEKIDVDQTKNQIDAYKAGYTIPGGSGAGGPVGQPSAGGNGDAPSQFSGAPQPAAAAPAGIAAPPPPAGNGTAPSPAATGATPRASAPGPAQPTGAGGGAPTQQPIPAIPGYSQAATADMVAQFVANDEKNPPNFGGGGIGRRQSEAFRDAVAAYKANNPQSDAGFEDYVKSIANYQEPPPTGYWASTPDGQKVLKALSVEYPDYSATNYPAAVQAIEAFNTKGQGNKVESFNVGIAHLDTLTNLVGALNNGNVQLFNKIGNQVAAEFGYPAPTNFDAAKAIVGDEIIKAIIGGGGALADRENAQNQVDSAKSPAQLLGVIQTYQQLMAGQLNGLQLQFTSSTHLPASVFQAKLFPETIQKLQADQGAGAQAAGGNIIQGTGEYQGFSAPAP